MSVNLQYNYARIDETGLCVSAATFSYEVNHPNWVLVGPNFEDYIDKYYNRADGKWYYDAAFTEEVVEFNN